MFVKQKVIKSIIDNLAFVFESVRLKNVIGLFDDNRAAQNFFRAIFQTVYDYQNLEDLDLLHGVSNFPAIDLGDTEKKIAIQVTTDNSSKKIQDTIDTFNKQELYKNYTRLIVFVLGSKKKYRKKFDTDSKFDFNPEYDIQDKKSLARDIEKISSMRKLRELEDFLRESLQEYKNPENFYHRDIEDCVEVLHQSMEKLLGANVVNAGEDLLAPRRSEDFSERKNNLNKVSRRFFKDMIVGHLHHNKTIEDFLKDPINRKILGQYYRVSQAIQKHYVSNKKKFSNLESVFEHVFNRLPNVYKGTFNNQKVKILLHNMYFNCDIGKNPDAQTK